MLKQLKLSHQGLILLLVPLIFEIAFVTALGWQMREFDDLLREVNQSRAFGATLDNMVENMYEIAQQLNIIRDAKRDPSILGSGAALADDMKHRLNSLETDVDKLETYSPTAVVADRVRMLARPIKMANRVLSGILDIYREQGLMTVYAILKGQDKRVADSFTATRDALINSLSELLKTKQQQQADYDAKIAAQENSFRRLIAIVIVGGAFHIMLAMFLWISFSRDTADNFRILMDNTRRLAQGQPLNPPISGTGEIAHLDRVFNDMAQALAAARRKERAIIENAIDVICSFDENAVFSAVSPACESLFGYKSEELIGKRFFDLIVDDDLQLAEQMVLKIKNEQQRGQFEVRVRKSGGTVVDVLWAIQWSDFEQSMFCVAHDITERKEIERMKQEFVAMVSHDLRTPLTSIQGFLTLLSTGMYGQLSPNGAENLAIADANISRLIGLINDLLDIEKMESGKMHMEKTNTDLLDVFQRSIDAVGGFAQQQKVKLVADATDLCVYADSDRLVQVLVNLISNAVKFSPQDSEVRLQAEDKGDSIEVRVIDHGRGIPAEYRKAVFERFQQVKSSDAKKKGGSGLGLAICKAIVEGHDGQIGVDSEEGKGSTFWFRIPKQHAVVGVSEHA